MRIDIITVLPEMIEGFFNCSIMKRAQNKGLAEIHIHNLRDYTEDKYRRVDDYPFGGFAGMVMKIEPIERCINALKAERDYDEVIFTTPDGEQFNQPMANSLSLAQNLIILCGHFKGIDYRIREHLITKEISIGDVAQLIKKTAGFTGELYFNKNKPDGTMRKLTDVSKLNALGWHHTIEIEEGIARLIDWYRSEE